MPDVKKDVFTLVHQFNSEIIGLPVPKHPKMLEGKRLDYTHDHLSEEIDELLAAETVEDQVDALVDLIYVAMGRLVEMGVDGRAHFDEVHAANMRRVRGQKSTRPNSLGYDAIKPEGWVGPDHTRVLVERRPLAQRDDEVSLLQVRDRVVYFGPEAKLNGKAGEIMEDHQSIRGGLHVRFDDKSLPIVCVSPRELRRESPKVLQAPVLRDEAVEAKPRIMVMGYARHGKDTVSDLLREKYGLRFTSSSQFCAERVVLPHVKQAWSEWHRTAADPRPKKPAFPDYDTVEECFDDRGNHRELWFNLITQFNTPDLTALGQAIFEGHDVYCGIRNAREFHALRNAGVFDVAIWVDAEERVGSREDRSSCTVEPWMADFVLDNNGTLADLERNLDVLMGRV